MEAHDPLKFVSSLGAKLATRSRHVCALFGAGVGKACGLPDVDDVQKYILKELEEEKRAALEGQLANRNLEGALSRIRRIAALVCGEDTVDGLTGSQAHELDQAICQLIVKSLYVPTADLDPMICLAGWASRANYSLPVELFTLNYDLLLEKALEQIRVPYFDGFTGTIEAKFHTELVEALPNTNAEAIPSFFVRLWKLHGSVNWSWNSNNEIVRLGDVVPTDSIAAIYPADTKYEDSRRVPFVVLQDRFRRALHHPETLMIIAGYSFSDDHINEQVFDAAMRRPRSEYIAFCYSDIPDALVEWAQISPNLQVAGRKEAIIGGVRAPWREPDETTPDIWRNGSFMLPSFECLARQLALSTSSEYQGDKHIRDLLKQAIEVSSTQRESDADD